MAIVSNPADVQVIIRATIGSDEFNRVHKNSSSYGSCDSMTD